MSARLPVPLAHPARVAALLLVLAPAAPARAATPSFDCSRAEPGSVEAMICADDSLAALDRRMAAVYAAALAKAKDEHPPTLKAEQRGWVKGRDDCWKSEDVRRCVAQESIRRIAELQARYRLVAARGPFFYACDDTAAKELVVTYFATDPPTLIAEFGDATSLMFRDAADTTGTYAGRNETFRDRDGTAVVRWGWEAPEMKCILRAAR